MLVEDVTRRGYDEVSEELLPAREGRGRAGKTQGGGHHKPLLQPVEGKTANIWIPQFNRMMSYNLSNN